MRSAVRSNKYGGWWEAVMERGWLWEGQQRDVVESRRVGFGRGKGLMRKVVKEVRSHCLELMARL